MRNLLLLMILAIAILPGCKQTTMEKTDSHSNVNQTLTESTIEKLISEHGEEFRFRIENGVNKVAGLWRESDGDEKAFEEFCLSQFIADEEELYGVFKKLETNYEILFGNMLRIKKDLMRPLHLDLGPIHPIDEKFGSYEPGAHITEDFFKNQIAFMVALNFPYYSLDEKTGNADNWNRRQWAYARMGDQYTSRIPAELIQDRSVISTATNSYIAQYNIYMGNLMDAEGNYLFPKELRLISHWGLRDELKSNYANENGLEKQNMIYTVMKRIIDQSIPEKVINSDAHTWDPVENKVYNDGAEVEFSPEPDMRYQQLLNNFLAINKIDPYYPNTPNYIQRQFEANMEIPQADVEKLFTDFVSSPQVKEVAAIISNRLGRPLQPFDIWYNGFRATGKYSEEELDKIVRQRYPDANAFEKDLPSILRKLGFEREKSEFIAANIKVEASRGAGHAWGGLIKDDKALLRSRIGADGMDFKGYNIAMHEYGHNVEQTISLHMVDYYSLNRVPNTAFTEALAFIFQKRDLEILGMKDDDPLKEHMKALATFWSCYEIMGVSLVDMNVWKWMYDNPNANASQLKEAVISIARDVWNKYYAPVFGQQDEPILAIYSHMISNPLYLSNYPLGHLIDFQIEQYIRDKNFADEVLRIYSLGSIIPQQWMKQAVGETLSIQPTLEATSEAIRVVGKRE